MKMAQWCFWATCFKETNPFLEYCIRPRKMSVNDLYRGGHVGEFFDLLWFTSDLEASSEDSSFSRRCKYVVHSRFKKLLSLNRRCKVDPEYVWFRSDHICRTTYKLTLLRKTILRSAVIQLRFRAQFWIFFLFTSLKIFRKLHIHEINIIE